MKSLYSLTPSPSMSTQRTISCSTASATASSRGKKSKQWKQHSNKKWRNYNTNLSCNLSQDFSYHYANRSYLTRTMSFDGTIPLNDLACLSNTCTPGNIEESDTEE